MTEEITYTLQWSTSIERICGTVLWVTGVLLFATSVFLVLYLKDLKTEIRDAATGEYGKLYRDADEVIAGTIQLVTLLVVVLVVEVAVFSSTLVYLLLVI
jgi:hypothetical protein